MGYILIIKVKKKDMIHFFNVFNIANAIVRVYFYTMNQGDDDKTIFHRDDQS